MLKKYLFTLLFFQILLSQAQDVVLSLDYTKTEIRTKRVELAVEINHGVNLSGTLVLEFGPSTSSLTTYTVATISPTTN